MSALVDRLVVEQGETRTAVGVIAVEVGRLRDALVDAQADADKIQAVIDDMDGVQQDLQDLAGPPVA